MYEKYIYINMRKGRQTRRKENVVERERGRDIKINVRERERGGGDRENDKKQE